MRERLDAIVAARQSGNLDEALRLAQDLRRDHPDDAEAALQCAWTLDRMGAETDAVPHYEQAIALGLPNELLTDALLGLGSTYRTLGRYGDALQTLEKGVRLFPEHRGMEVFRAMALYNNGRAKDACEAFLRVIAESSNDDSVSRYGEALTIYAEDIDRVWS